MTAHGPDLRECCPRCGAMFPHVLRAPRDPDLLCCDRCGTTFSPRYTRRKESPRHG